MKTKYDNQVKFLKLDIQRFADAEIKFKVDLDSKSAESGLSKLGNIGKTAFKTTAIAIGTVSTALGGLVMKTVSMAGELEQQLGGSEAVFEQFAETVKQKGTEAYKVMGLSQNDYLATANKMGSLMQGAGLSVEKSMDLSTQAMQRAADVASVMGISTESAMESIAGAAKGNFTMMDNLGVAMNDTTLQAYALEKGITKSTQAMTNAEKVELAMQMFLERTSKYAGNYAKENETFAGSFSTLKASISNFLSGAGDINQVIDSVINFANILVKSIGDMAPKLVEGIIQLINGIAPQLPKLLKQLLPVIIAGAIDLINGLVKSLPSLIPVLMNGIVQAFSGIVQILPQLIQALITGTITIIQALAEQLPTLLPQIIEAILQLIPILLNNLPLFINAGIQLIVGLANGLVNSIPVIIDMLPQIIESLINGLMGALPQLILLGPQLMLGLAKGLLQAIPSLISITPKIWQGLVNGIKSGLGSFTSVGSNLIKGLWQGIQDVTGWIISKIKGFGNNILKTIKGIFGIHSPSKEFAWVGKMNMLGLEEGMEDMIPDLNSTIYKAVNLDYDTTGLEFLKNGSLNVSSNFGNSIPNYNSSNNINIVVNADMDVNKFGKAFVRDVKTFSGGTKNSYNYGGGQ